MDVVGQWRGSYLQPYTVEPSVLFYHPLLIVHAFYSISNNQEEEKRDQRGGGEEGKCSYIYYIPSI